MAKNDKLEIVIPVDDWDEEHQQSGREIENKEDIIRYLKEGVKPSELARNVIIARERGHADVNIIKPNKGTLNVGGAYQISQLAARQYEERGTKSGEIIRARKYTCETDDDNDNDPAMVDSISSQGAQRAINYLHSIVIGHIKSRLNIIALALGKESLIENGDILLAEIKALIDDIASKLE